MDNKMTLNIAIVTSGRGTLLKYTLSAIHDGILDSRVVAVLTNRDCGALAVATAAGVPLTQYFEVDAFTSRNERDQAMGKAALSVGANFALVGGYTEVLESTFLDHFPNRAISVYPTLLPSFGELDEAIGPALDYGVKVLGLTIHFRTPLSLSDGPIIAQYPFAVDSNTEIETVIDQIAALEREHLPRIMQAFAEDRVVCSGMRVEILKPRGLGRAG